MRHDLQQGPRTECQATQGVTTISQHITRDNHVEELLELSLKSHVFNDFPSIPRYFNQQLPPFISRSRYLSLSLSLPLKCQAKEII